MGKSEIAALPLAKPSNLNLLMPETQESFEITPLKRNKFKNKTALPADMEFFGNQVAGHKDKESSIGMIKSDGTVLKPITKPACGEREIAFYEELNRTTDHSLLVLKQFVPRYFGTKEVSVGGQDVRCIELEDLTSQYKEPCIMDVKIGRRTWDPTATFEKIDKEESKYRDCKRDLGFCVPGFQVFRISSGRLCKYGKEYGKRLTRDTLLNAVRIFLNADVGLCRNLLVQILTHLWRILHWARNQRRVHLYSSSILLIYDAHRLRESLKINKNKPASARPALERSTSLYRPLSLAVLNHPDRIPTGFSGQLTKEGPILHYRRNSKTEYVDEDAHCWKTASHPWQKSVRNLKRTHSFQNDYDKDVQGKKQDYKFLLDGLMVEKKSEIWATVKMIDFAHVFPTENRERDGNYLHGVENLVKLFEDLLMQTEASL